ncbi:hypothetical protein S40285_09107 [Stachybotrys chlorohalonatus IBT 40285]|uniref:Uncharacterized protein n=1 Tax=Stachybotrys chlorohalonatus (strain IBT 40285) TaxID=1283841 RepID=A0A084R039_STAC4|nr:hypothetical protein S40285_09107 [Stachybotrys chlorohalonata IBT 40285]
MASPFFPSLTKVWHRESYPAISPSRPEISAKGKVVVITGGASGIGSSITRTFAAGGSTKNAILARREENLVATKESIERDFPSTEILGLSTDITSRRQVEDAFAKIAETFGEINVFVSSAAYMPTGAPVLSQQCDLDDWWQTFTTNILGVIQASRAFARHAADGARVLNVSTCLATTPPLEPNVSAYAASKAASSKVFDFIALENPGLKVFNIHPGLVETEMSLKSGHGGMDHIDLSGDFCLWLTSPEADFLSGKWVWVNWNVDELKARTEEILTTDLLDTKLGGVSFAGFNGNVRDI